MAEAVTDILVGNADPGGRLPMTFPLAVEDNPSDAFYPGEDLVMRYGEGQMVGYRGYDAAGIYRFYAGDSSRNLTQSIDITIS